MLELAFAPTRPSVTLSTRFVVELLCAFGAFTHGQTDIVHGSEVHAGISAALVTRAAVKVRCSLVILRRSFAGLVHAPQPFARRSVVRVTAR
jgi:hypothetical protein